MLFASSQFYVLYLDFKKVTIMYYTLGNNLEPYV